MAEEVESIRCEKCNRSPEDLRREGRFPRVERGPGTAAALCNLHWAESKPSWHVGPTRG